MLPSECFDSLIILMTRNWQVSELNDNDHSANDDEDFSEPKTGVSLLLLNPLHPYINMHILLTILHTLP